MSYPTSESSMHAPAVTVIVPTTAEAAGFSSLQRAVASIRSAAALAPATIVVVYGSASDSAVLAWLASQADVRLEASDVPSAQHAVLHGRRLVATPFFSTLADEAACLPGGIDLQLAAMQAHP